MLDGKPLGSRSENPLTPDEGVSPYNYKRPHPQYPSVLYTGCTSSIIKSYKIW